MALRSTLLLVPIALFLACDTARPLNEAETIVEDYIRMRDAAGKEDIRRGRIDRVTLLRSLGGFPDQAVDAVRAALPRIEDHATASEMIEMLGRQVRTEKCAAFLCELLDHPDPNVRGKALHGLRLMAARVNRSGFRFPGGEHEPAMPGLVPHLLKASRDPDRGVRKASLWALADTRDPAAALVLRSRISDPEGEDRFLAACLLTEFGDPSGLPVLLAKLERLVEAGAGSGADRKSPPDFRFHHDALHLLHAFERITGESMGEIPGHPCLYSHLGAMAAAEARIPALLDEWKARWEER
jgi:HEAT repeat protein